MNLIKKIKIVLVARASSELLTGNGGQQDRNSLRVELGPRQESTFTRGGAPLAVLHHPRQLLGAQPDGQM